MFFFYALPGLDTCVKALMHWSLSPEGTLWILSKRF